MQMVICILGVIHGMNCSLPFKVHMGFDSISWKQACVLADVPPTEHFVVLTEDTFAVELNRSWSQRKFMRHWICADEAELSSLILKLEADGVPYVFYRVRALGKAVTRIDFKGSV